MLLLLQPELSSFFSCCRERNITNTCEGKACMQGPLVLMPGAKSPLTSPILTRANHVSLLLLMLLCLGRRCHLPLDPSATRDHLQRAVVRGRGLGEKLLE